ncbi:MAG TPA: type II toxin-antitoxin system RelB/DinJ family antitoxin [Candidatus Bathyarchaeia archaeon]|nr:type II toxin-antitoxin system RelB/DinJ family antitoxin [Candidatus Bathyarchaeia archaeon]
MNNTTLINIRTDTEIKNQARAVAEKLGLSLSAIINAYLRQLIRTKSVSFNLNEEPTDYLLQTLKNSKKDIKVGFISPALDKADEAIKWLNNPNRKYANQL